MACVGVVRPAGTLPAAARSQRQASCYASVGSLGSSPRSPSVGSSVRGSRRQQQCQRQRQQRQQRQQQQLQRGRLRPQAQGDQGEGELDLVERFVGKLFGKAVLEDPTPGGLKRLDDEAAKELYPAVTDQWAAPVESDSEDVALLRPLLAQTQLEKTSLRLAYNAAEHGWSAAAFHERVDGFGAALVVAETAGGAVVGGYNPRGWISLGEDRDSIAAFLFTWPDGDVTRRPIKLPKVGGAALAVVRDQPGLGIFFGPDGLAIPLAPGSDRAAKCKLGPYYSRMPSGGKSLFAAGESQRGTELTSLGVFVAEGAGEEWELDGIVWRTKTGS